MFRSSFEAKVLGTFAFAALVLAALTAGTWRVAQNAVETAQSVAHTHDVIDQLALTRLDTLQIEYSTQSFRITGDPRHLTERNATIANREAALQRLQHLVAEDPQQRDDWKRLRAVIDERLAISRQVELLRKTQGEAAASAYVATAPLQATRERSYHLMQVMQERERTLRQQRQATQLRLRRTLLVTGTLASVLLGGLLLATYGLIRRQLRETEAGRQALASSEYNLHITLQSIGDGVLATDDRGRITRLNPVAERLTGWTQAQALGHPVDEVFRIVNAYTRAPAEVPVARVLATGVIQGLANHTVLLARDGSACPIADSASPIRDGAGHITGVVLVFRDCSAEYQAEQQIRAQNELLDQRVTERTAQLRESEDHLRSVTNNVPALIAYVDAQQRYVYANRQYRQCYAPERNEISGCTVREVLGDARYALIAPLIAEVLQGRAQSLDWEPFPGVWQALSYVPKWGEDQQVVGYYILNADITERKRAEKEIQSLNAALAQRVQALEHASRALETLSAGNRAMLHATDEQSLLDTMCREMVRAGRYAAAAIWYRDCPASGSLRPMAESGFPGGLTALRALAIEWTDPHDRPKLQLPASLGSVLACPLKVTQEVLGCIAVFAVAPNYFQAQEEALITESADDLAYGIATLRARSAQKEAQQRLVFLSRHDALTGLPNEASFIASLQTAMGSVIDVGGSLAVLQFNIERLGDINAALGFSQGDQILREFGARLRVAVPDDAVVARLRGDEFALLLPSGTASDAVTLLQRLEPMWAHPFPIADLAVDVSARVGIAVFPVHGATVHDLLRNVDLAVSVAKRKGLDHVVFDPGLNRERPQRLTLASELRRAIEGGDLRLYLQPKIEMATGRVCGAEGLVRWQHGTRGLIPPAEFIELAEHTGLIKPMCEWVITAALDLNRQWVSEACAVPIAVNLSARNLRDEHLLDKILRLQSDAGIPAGLLELEITESTVMDDSQLALRVLHSLREAGIPLAIDDFGTGYSSLSYLQKLPVEAIKIDQSFVLAMPTDKDSAVIVRSTIDLIHDLDRRVVAEGVETRTHWDQLVSLGCDVAQGYFIARPMPAEAFQPWRRHYRVGASTG